MLMLINGDISWEHGVGTNVTVYTVHVCLLHECRDEMLCAGWLCLSNLPVAYFTLFVAVCESMSQIHAVCECVGLVAVSARLSANWGVFHHMQYISGCLHILSLYLKGPIHISKHSPCKKHQCAAAQPSVTCKPVSLSVCSWLSQSSSSYPFSL